MSSDPNIVKLRDLCLKRGANSIKGITRQFRILDDDGNRQVSLEEFSKGIHDFGLSVSAEEAKEMFNAFDTDGQGSIGVEEFLKKLRGNMSASRVDAVNKAFKKADRTGDGILTFQDLKDAYSARKHPKYMNGEWTEKQCLEAFLNSFEPDESKRDGVVTLEEFVNYYCGVSSNIDNDAYFNLMMRNAWKI